MSDITTVILGGGRGTRLYPLTKQRAKPGVPIAGKFRLIDISMSNCIHSGLHDIFLLTQFNSASLNHHITEAFQFGSVTNQSLRILAAQQTHGGADWYQGTADAVRQNLEYILNSRGGADHILVLAGDHLYRMDYRRMIESHLRTNADLTVSAMPVDVAETSRFGILKADPQGRVTHFVEKPQSHEDLAQLETNLSESVFAPTSGGERYIASMGIYLFKRDVLIDKVQNAEMVDFGQDILPASIQTNEVRVYPFSGYWEDIGTIQSFYKANMGFLDTVPKFNFYDETSPIYTLRHHLPGTKVNESRIVSSILADGSIIDRSDIRSSVIGSRSIVHDGSTIDSSYVMGASYYESADEIARKRENGIPPIGIGPGSLISGAIIDKDARIGEGVILANRDGTEHLDADNYCIRDRLVVVPKGAVIPAGSVI